MLPVFLGAAVLLTCGPLSVIPAVYLSEHTPKSRIVFDYPDGHPVWVAPWLFYTSKAFHCLALAGIGLALVGMFSTGWKKRKPHH